MNLENEESMDAGHSEQGRRYRVIADYQTEYPDPISVSAGETFQVSEKTDFWNGNPDWVWVWCTDLRGKQGWVPKTLIHFNADGTTGTARVPYSARELTITTGEELVAEQEESGWLWSTNEQGQNGWVPSGHLAPLPVE
jgi:hypothetical protein